jgi:hypothetical protein
MIPLKLKLSKIFAFAFGLFISTLGCWADSASIPPADSGFIETHVIDKSGDHTKRRVLLASQVIGLREWVQSHANGWYRDAQDNPPGTMIFLSLGSKSTTVLNLLDGRISIGSQSRALNSSEEKDLRDLLRID